MNYTYSDRVLDYEEIGLIKWKELNFPESTDTIPFPQVALKKAFGIIFKSTIHVPRTGTYGFALNSDDGSVLWIDGDKVVDNDRTHGMEARANKRYLKKGSYPITVWYFQAYPDRYGIEFTSKFLAPNKVADALQTGNVQQVFILNNSALYFPTNGYLIDEKGAFTIEQLVQELSTESIEKITIIGHTDNVGQAETNLQLSTNRAIAVANQLRNLLPQSTIEFSVLGKGEQQAIADNTTEEGRQQNRRVEILIQ